MYVALLSSDSLLKGNIDSMTFGGGVVVGNSPPHVVINSNGTRAYATLQLGHGVAVVDAVADTLIGTVPLSSEGFNLLLSPDGHKLYATTSTGTVYAINTATNAVIDTFAVGPVANGLAFSPDGHTLYISSRDSGTVAVVNPLTDKVVRKIPVGGAPQRLAVSPDGATLYAANEVNGLDVVNLSSDAVQHLDVGGQGYGLGLTPDGEQLYVLVANTGTVLILDRASLATVRELQVGGTPRNVAFNASGTTAAVTNQAGVVFIQ
jgi:YVTN family beta-propeller protein